MYSYLPFLAGIVIAFVAIRAARRSARSTELRLLAGHVARQARRDLARNAVLPDAPAAWERDVETSSDPELRRIRGERAPSLYTPEQARAAKRAMEPVFEVRMRVKP